MNLHYQIVDVCLPCMSPYIKPRQCTLVGRRRLAHSKPWKYGNICLSPGINMSFENIPYQVPLHIIASTLRRLTSRLPISHNTTSDLRTTYATPNFSLGVPTLIFPHSVTYPRTYAFLPRLPIYLDFLDLKRIDDPSTWRIRLGLLEKEGRSLSPTHARNPSSPSV